MGWMAITLNRCNVPLSICCQSVIIKPRQLFGAIAMDATLLRPSKFIGDIHLEQVEGLALFKFGNELQERMEWLLERRKSEELTAAEALELEEIGELDRIFTHMNAMLVANR